MARNITTIHREQLGKKTTPQGYLYRCGITRQKDKRFKEFSLSWVSAFLDEESTLLEEVKRKSESGMQVSE